MAHIATKRFNYATQFAILLVLTGVGLIVGGIASLLPLIGKVDFSKLSNLTEGGLMQGLLKPENANAFRMMQFITTLFLFFIPAVIYAKICHKKAFLHLGFIKAPGLKQLLLVAGIMFFALFIVGALAEIWKHIPFSAAWQLKFKTAEEMYNKQMQVMARMDNVSDLVISLLIVALLPAVFEEVIFRGALQNLFSRWLKAPVWAIVITAVIFSAIHGSYDGFLPRAVLGFILGWLFYRTGNIWLNIAAHFLNNAIGILSLYYYSTPGKPTDMSKIDDSFPIWLGAVGVIGVIALLLVFDKVSKNDIDRPGQEVMLPGYINPNDPFTEEVNNIGNQNQA
jgi:membrane protease YdiL (CAAX protease family)